VLAYSQLRQHAHSRLAHASTCACRSADNHSSRCCPPALPCRTCYTRPSITFVTVEHTSFTAASPHMAAHKWSLQHHMREQPCMQASGVSAGVCTEVQLLSHNMGYVT
jgi:hypothetical protein